MAPSGGHIHSGGCCGSSSSLSSPSFRKTLSQSRVFKGSPIDVFLGPAQQTTLNTNLLESESATVAGATLADALKGRLVEIQAEKAFGAVLERDTIFRNSTSPEDKSFAMAVTKKTLSMSPNVSSPDLTRVIKQEMTKKLDSEYQNKI